MFHLSEAEIMSNWLTYEPIRVSICCITYKQEQYISQAIDSFLMQKTCFPFEIIIGEDCGDDNTLAILADYKQRYPNLIRIITSKENVGANANLLRVFKVALGDYIAVCEGDDYWIDDLKLQKQYDYLNSLPNINICFTAAQTINSAGKVKLIANYSKNKEIVPLSIVVRSGGGFMPTASIMFDKKIINKIPVWFETAPVGDIYLQIIASIGGAAYMPDLTSAYRLNSIGSWSEREALLEKKVSLVESLNTLNKYLFFADSLIDLGVEYIDIAFLKAVTKSDTSKLLLVGNVKDYDTKELKVIIFDLITSSWNEYKRANSQQVVMYRLRYCYCVLRFILKLRKLLRRSFD